MATNRKLENRTNNIPPISIISMNISGLNAPVKRDILRGYRKKKDPIICCPQEIHFKYKGIEIK